MYAKIFHVSIIRICVNAQKIHCWKTLFSEIIIRNFCTWTQKSSTFLLRICVYAQKKSKQMNIMKTSNNTIVDVLRLAQKLQVWNTYIPAIDDTLNEYY